MHSIVFFTFLLVPYQMIQFTFTCTFGLQVLLTVDVQFKLGAKVFSFLLDMFLYHDFSVLNFIHSYKVTTYRIR